MNSANGGRRATWLTLLLVAACNAQPDDAMQLAGAEGMQAMGAEESTTGQAESSPVAEARADLASRLGIELDQIEVLEFLEVTWPDTSIGCPQPGMMYAQRVVNGSRIVLQARGREHHYHIGGGRGPFYCANPQPAAGDHADFGDI